MNPLDLYALDQKSWAFLNLIGQTPLTFPTTILNSAGYVTGGSSPLNPGGLGASRWVIDNQAGQTRFFTYGPSAAVNGSFVINSQRSDGSNSLDILSISATGVATSPNKIYPGTDAAVAQSASGLYAGTGVPNNANGENGDFYFRSDGGAGTCIYQRRAGAWIATGA